MQLNSPLFQNNEMIPERYTCEGDSVNPPLVIKDVPDGAKSLVLIVDDIDASGGSFIHWCVFDIPPETRTVEEDGIPGKQAVNSAKRKGYAGPCPPTGAHRYVFRLYALDAVLGLPEGARTAEVQMLLQEHVIAEARLTGRYKMQVTETV